MTGHWPQATQPWLWNPVCSWGWVCAGVGLQDQPGQAAAVPGFHFCWPHAAPTGMTCTLHSCSVGGGRAGCRAGCLGHIALPSPQADSQVPFPGGYSLPPTGTCEAERGPASLIPHTTWSCLNAFCAGPAPHCKPMAASKDRSCPHGLFGTKIVQGGSRKGGATRTCPGLQGGPRKM